MMRASVNLGFGRNTLHHSFGELATALSLLTNEERALVEDKAANERAERGEESNTRFREYDFSDAPEWARGLWARVIDVQDDNSPYPNNLELVQDGIDMLYAFHDDDKKTVRVVHAVGEDLMKVSGQECSLEEWNAHLEKIGLND